MKLRIPRRLIIRGRAWRVVFTPEPFPIRGKMCFGVCDHTRHRIRLWAQPSRAKLEEAFAHELAHALAGPASSMREVAAEERVVRRMAPALRALLVSGRRWRAPRRCAAARAVSAAGAARGRVAG